MSAVLTGLLWQPPTPATERRTETSLFRQKSAGPERHDAFLLELEHRSQIHLRGVDEVVPVAHSSIVYSFPPRSRFDSARVRSVWCPKRRIVTRLQR